MSNAEELFKSLNAMNEKMIEEEQALKDQIAALQALVDAMMLPHQPAPENKPAEPTITVVNVETGEEKVITRSEYNEMVNKSIN